MWIALARPKYAHPARNASNAIVWRALAIEARGLSASFVAGTGVPEALAAKVG
jgi:hypothetical protein